MKQSKQRRATKKTSADKALAEARNLLRAVFQCVQDGISVLTSDLTIKGVNKTVERWYAHNMPIVGKKCFEAYHNFTEPCDPCPALKAIRDKKLSVEVVPLRAAEGAEGWLEVYAYPLLDEEGKVEGVAEFVRDITARINMQQQLQESEEKYRLIFEHSPLGVCHIDKEGVITTCNDNFVKIFGARREEATGFNLFSLTDKNVTAAARRCLQGNRVNYEGWPRFLLFDKATYVRGVFAPVLDGGGNVKGGVCIVEDYTEQKLREQLVENISKECEKVFEGTQDAMFLVKAQEGGGYRYVRGNRAFVQATGLSLETLRGKSPQELFGEEVGRQIAANYTHCLEKGGPLTFEETLDLPTGKKIWQTVLTPLLVDDGIFVVGSSRDITALKAAEEKIRFLSFHDSLTGLYNRRYMEEEMRRLNTRRQLPLCIIMADLNGLKLINDTYGHSAGDRLLRVAAAILRDSCRREDILGRWGGDEFVLLLPQTAEETARSVCKRIKEASAKTYLEELPVSFALGYAVKETAEESLATTLKKAEDWMYRHKLVEGRSARSAVLQSLLKALEAKSYETEIHTKRMEAAALQIGRELGLIDSELTRLKLAVTLHDIGKINLPEEILTKKEALNLEEWEKIRKHPETGFRIARATEEFNHVAEEILCHHERWDGSGYPRGLKGEEIPLLARIIALVDAWEVMTNGRPYKEAMSKEKTVEELRRGAGTQFDPALVEILLHLPQWPEGWGS